mgnify:CR=1 FL=1
MMNLHDLKTTMMTLIGEGRDHVNGEWFGVTEKDMDLIEKQAKELIHDYFDTWAKREALIDDDNEYKNLSVKKGAEIGLSKK